MVSKIEFEPTATIGARVHGVDYGNLSEADKKTLYAGWLQHGVLIFPEAGTSTRVHLDLSRVFGPLEVHPHASLRVEGNEDLIYLGGEGQNKGPMMMVNGEGLAGFIYYHQDTSFTPNICKGSLLRMMEIPASGGGDTVWVDTAKVYEALPDDVKARVETMETRQSSKQVVDRAWGMEDWEIRLARADEGPNEPYKLDPLPDVIQPMVITHPESGIKSLLLSPQGFVEVIGMDKVEGDAFFNELVRHALRPEFQHRHKWKLFDMVLWDNRRTMHFATGYPYHERRLILRTTLGGAQKTGRYYREHADAA